MGTFIKKTLSILISLILLIAVSGCSVPENSKTNQSTPKPESSSEVANNTNDNDITIGVIDIDAYNPLTTKSVTVKNMLGFIYEPLFTLDGSHKVTSVLADSYKIAPDGKSIKVNLKKNVAWHDGKWFSAKDVVYTINMIINNDTTYTNTLRNVESVSATDNYSLNISFNRSVPNAVMLLSFPIIEDGTFEEQSKPVGTGPFYYDNDRLKAFESYHGTKPQIKHVNIKKVPDEEKFTSLFNASVIDVADSSIIEMSKYTPRSNASVNDYISNEMIFVGFNSASSVFSKTEARKSVFEIIDRKNVVSQIYFSRAKESFYPMNPDFKFYPSVTENIRGNSGEAEKYLIDAGWVKDGNGTYYLANQMGVTYFGVEILVNSGDEKRVAIAKEISKNMTEIGMKNTVVECSESDFSARINNNNYDMFIGKTVLLPNNDCSNLIAEQNIFNYSDEKTEILLSQLGTLSDEDDIIKVYNEFFEQFRNECPLAPICFLKESIITSAKIKSGVTPSVSGTIMRTENWRIK